MLANLGDIAIHDEGLCPLERVHTSGVNIDDLDSLDAAIDACYTCQEQHKLPIEHKPIKIARGDVSASIMVIAMAPGPSATKANIALAGGSFSRLHKYFEDAGFGGSADDLRREMYITSLLKCGPPANRQRDVLKYFAQCGRFLWRQLELVKPTHVILLGLDAARLIVGGSETMHQMAGRMWSDDELNEGELFPTDRGDVQWLTLPHPSGACRLWNDPSVMERSITGLTGLIEHAQLSKG